MILRSLKSDFVQLCYKINHKSILNQGKDFESIVISCVNIEMFQND